MATKDIKGRTIDIGFNFRKSLKLRTILPIKRNG
jgi:hypothetical protein